jgi:hypothetical protein
MKQETAQLSFCCNSYVIQGSDLNIFCSKCGKEVKDFKTLNGTETNEFNKNFNINNIIKQK